MTPRKRQRRPDVKRFLNAMLYFQAMPARFFEQWAAENNISERRLKQAKVEMGIVSFKRRWQGHWFWGLPKPGQNEIERQIYERHSRL